MKRKILLIYPEIPATYWSFKYALSFVGYKTLMPPLGLITVAAMMPENYELKLIDMNTGPLRDEDILAADMVFLSAMIVQKDSFQNVVSRCNRLGTPIAAGGPYPTNAYQNIQGVDYFILNEAEITLPRFLEDLDKGTPKKIYRDETKPEITQTPIPRFDLLDLSAYSTMALQSSRGCPFNCEFCDIIEMFGRVPRYKHPDQFIGEMERLHEAGYRGPLFIVDDNFIGNKKKVRELLESIIEWQEARNHPFTLFTEASINLAQDEPLVDLMVRAGFTSVFIGIETPITATLTATQKQQNTKMDILESIRLIQARGIEVMAGFIVGFDSDPENIFDLQIEFIQKAGIPMAMIGTMIALPNTQLYRRLEREGRIIRETDGNNTHSLEMNFIPRMPAETIKAGYKKIIASIYRPKNYFTRCRTLLKRMPQKNGRQRPITANDLRAAGRSLYRQTFSRYGLHYLGLLASTLLRNPKQIAGAINLAVKGHHFFKMTSDIIKADETSESMRAAVSELEERMENRMGDGKGINPAAIQRLGARAQNRIYRLYKKLNPELKDYLKETYDDLQMKCETITYLGMENTVSHEDILMNQI